MTRLLLVSITATLLFAGKLIGQIAVPNGNFEQADNSSPTKTANWVIEGTPAYCGVDAALPWKGNYSMKISSSTPGAMYFFNEEFPFESKSAKKYKIRCAVKTKNLDGRAGFGARVFDKEGRTIMLTLFTLTESKNQSWKTAEGEFYSDDTAVKIRIFGNITGSGDAWFDDIVIEEVAPASDKPAPKVEKYINEYFDIVNEHSIVKDKEYIAQLKKNTLQLCAGVSDMKSCHDVLKKYTTRKLHDRHSFFSTPKDWKELTVSGRLENGTNTHNLPSGKMLDDSIAYLVIPMFVSFDEKMIAEYVDSTQALIARMDAQNPKGWIIDISANTGGHSFAMVAGLGPLLGNGICGYSFSGDGSTRTRICNEGWTGWDSSLVVQKLNPYHLKNPGKAIAIIYGNQTASSGEVVAIAFIGMQQTKSFGQKTTGATTRIDNFRMSDGAYLNLAAGVDADRNGNAFGGKITPDVETTDNETAIAEAIKWILKSKH
jgi:hypothetical protein